MPPTQPRATRGNLSYQVFQAGARVGRLADAVLLRDHDIRFSQFQVLITVGTNNHATLRELAEALGVARDTVGRRVRALRDRRLVSLAPDPDQPRANAVALTEPGARLLYAAWNSLASLESTLFAGVDRTRLEEALARIAANAEPIETTHGNAKTPAE